MKKIVAFVLLSTALFAEVNVQGHISLDSNFFIKAPSDKHQNNFTSKQEFELTYNSNEFDLYAKLYAQEDYYDFFASEHNHRSFVDLKEFYLSKEQGDYRVQIGKSVKFWGALEVMNIVDVFNTQDLRNDFLDNDRLGAYNAELTYFTESGEMSLIVKTNEVDQKMSAYPYVYYTFPKALSYNDNLQTEQGRNRPTIYATLNGSTDSEYPIDYAFIVQNGYDSQRYFSANGTTLSENAYLVNKFMTYNTFVIDATLVKLEALYTDVIDNKNVSDYMNIGLGVEHTLEILEDGSELGLIAEYYNYKTYDDTKFSDLDLYVTFQNDLFLGLRWSLNDVDDTKVVGGVVQDFDYHEQSYYVEYERRVGESFKLSADVRYIEPSLDTPTAFRSLGAHKRVAVEVGYYF